VERLGDLQPGKIQAATGILRNEGMAEGTIAHHLRAVKGFSRWLARDGRQAVDVLAYLKLPSPDSDRRRVRRVFELDEAERLIRAAETGRSWRTVSGKARAILYRAAMGDRLPQERAGQSATGRLPPG
jgi:site-specific recombinase XerC